MADGLGGTMKKALSVVLLLVCVVGRASEGPVSPQTANLDDQLNALATPGNEAPAGVTGEQLYAVQTRYSPLRLRHELAVGGGYNFSSDGFLNSMNLDASYRFYLTDRLYVSLAGNAVFNS